MATNHTTVELTKKSLKAQKAMATFSGICGLVMIFSNMPKEGQTPSSLFGWGIAVVLLAGIWGLAVRLSIWWNHA